MYFYDYDLIKQDLEACNYVYQDFIGERITADTNHDYKVKLNRYLTTEAKQSKIKKKQLWRDLINEVNGMIESYHQRWFLAWRPIIEEAIMRTKVILDQHHIPSNIRNHQSCEMPYILTSGTHVDVRPNAADRSQSQFRPIRVDFVMNIQTGCYARQSNNHWTHEDWKQELNQMHEAAQAELQNIISDHLKWNQILLEIDQMIEHLFQEKQVVWPKI